MTEREVEVLRLVAREQTNPSAAQALGISGKTVERHVTHIYQKIGVSSRAGATIHALEKGLMWATATEPSPVIHKDVRHSAACRPPGSRQERMLSPDSC